MAIEKRFQCPYYHRSPKVYKVIGKPFKNHLANKHSDEQPHYDVTPLEVYVYAEFLPKVKYANEDDVIRYVNMKYKQQEYDQQVEELAVRLSYQCKVNTSATSQHNGAESYVSGRGNNAAEMHRGRQSWRNCPSCENGLFQHPIGAPCPPEAYDPNYQRNIHARRGSRRPNGRNCLGLCDNCKQPGHYIQYCPMLYHVYIGSLAFRTTEDDLGNYMSQAGSIAYIRVVYHQDSGQSRGFAFCGFYEEKSAQWAIKKLDGKYFDGRYIRVNWNNKWK